MNGFYRALSISLGTSLALLCSPVITGGAPMAMMDSGKIAHAPLNLVPRIPPPIAGIKLLEDIFTRMHSLPQLAFNSKMKPVVQQAQGPMQQQLTNPSLAIKPQEQARTSKIAMASAKAEYVPSDLLQDSAYGKDFKDKERRQELPRASNYRGSAMDRTARITSVAMAAPGSAPAEASTDRLYPAKERRKIAQLKTAERDEVAKSVASPAPARPSADAVSAQLGGANSNVANVGDQQYSQKKEDSGRLEKALAAASSADREAEETQHPGFVAMNRAVGKLYNITNQMQKAQQAADGMAAGKLAGTAAVGYRRQSFGSSGLRAAEHVSSVDARNSVTISESPRVTEYKNGRPAGRASIGGAAGAGEPGANDEFAAGTNGQGQPARIDQPGLFKYTREYGNIPYNKQAPRPSLQVAMNAPNVITGIPLLRLGTLAHDAETVLSTTYSVKQQQLEGWTVFTATKSHSQDAAVQLYIKHGMVEAMRIFDRSLIPLDLGVGLGDNLQSLKSRFGEPAFLIREPGDQKGLSGQNYVYPISQVSFQLARTRKGAPEVVSVLIFNVK